MSEPFECDPSQDPASGGGTAGEGEVLDALPVLMGRPRIVPAEQTPTALSDQRWAASMIPAVQAAAVAAGGFVAGAAVVGLVHRRHRHSTSLPRGRRASRELSKGAGGRPGARALELVQIVGSRSLLVDVHLLGSSDDR